MNKKVSVLSWLFALMLASAAMMSGSTVTLNVGNPNDPGNIANLGTEPLSSTGWMPCGTMGGYFAGCGSGMFSLSADENGFWVASLRFSVPSDVYDAELSFYTTYGNNHYVLMLDDGVIWDSVVNAQSGSTNCRHNCSGNHTGSGTVTLTAGTTYTLRWGRVVSGQDGNPFGSCSACSYSALPSVLLSYSSSGSETPEPASAVFVLLGVIPFVIGRRWRRKR